MRRIKKALCMVLTAGLVLGSAPCGVDAATDTKVGKKAGISLTVKADGEYINWDGVSNVSEFKNKDGYYCFAYKSGKNVIVCQTKSGAVNKKITLPLKGTVVGGVTCDSSGYYYVVSGKTNTGSDRSTSTVYITKYSSKGKLIKTVGDDGRSSLAYYYDDLFNTKTPFSGGGCDIAINGNLLAVNYARTMYSDHQSNSVFAINTKTMKKVNYEGIYNSHSFGQRAAALGNGFIFASEDDCYSRAFTITKTDSSKVLYNSDIFSFWVKENALNNWDMWTLNNNFAHIGDLAVIDKNTVAFMGTSAKSLSSKAASEKEQVFVQIFNPNKNIESKSAYITSGTRTGLGGPNGDEKVTDYGVKWLTTSSKYTYSHPQMVYDKNGHIVVLFELYSGSSYKGVYYITLNKSGKVVKKMQQFSKTAKLNPCETPVVVGKTIYWTANRTSGKKLYNFRLKIN